MLAVVIDDAVVRIPGVDVRVDVRTTPHLDETHASLHQPPRHQALASERRSDLAIESVKLLRRFGLLPHVDGFRSTTLHAIRKLVRRDACSELACAGKSLLVPLIQPREV